MPRANLTFGEIVQDLRRDKSWTVKDLIERLEARGGRKVSPAYITRIEQYNEIPSPEMICLLADVFGRDPDEFLDSAKESKIRKFDEALSEKYKKAAGLFRTQRGK